MKILSLTVNFPNRIRTEHLTAITQEEANSLRKREVAGKQLGSTTILLVLLFHSRNRKYSIDKTVIHLPSACVFSGHAKDAVR